MIFVDEAKFATKKLARARKVGLRGTERVVVDRRPNEPSVNMLLMTTLALSDDPLFFELCADNIDGDAFLTFIEGAIQHGRVPPGSVIVWDNARVHATDATVAILDGVINGAGATRANLPRYSPEFNPCELVFGEIKTFMRNHPRLGWSLRDRVLEAAGTVSYDNLLAYYQHCTQVALEGL